MVILSESLISLTTAAKSAPGGRVNPSTVYRWAMKGCRGIRLETVMRGGIRMTSREALNRFFEATTTAANGGLSPRSAPERRAAVATAAKQLDAAGI